MQLGKIFKIFKLWRPENHYIFGVKFMHFLCNSIIWWLLKEILNLKSAQIFTRTIRVELTGETSRLDKSMRQRYREFLSKQGSSELCNVNFYRWSYLACWLHIWIIEFLRQILMKDTTASNYTFTYTSKHYISRGKTGIRCHLYNHKGMRGMCDVTRYQGD